MFFGEALYQCIVACSEMVLGMTVVSLLVYWNVPNPHTYAGETLKIELVT
jgi:hypothetical protein